METYTIPQAAQICSVSRGTVWRWVKAGKLRAAVTAGGHHRIRKDDLLPFTQPKRLSPPLSLAEAGKRLLIVDDDKSIRRLIRRALNGCGWHVAQAADGFEAGKKMIQFDPHLVILDLFMPNMDGFLVCKQIKRAADTAKTKVIAISGFNTRENRQRIRDCGADLFLPKPLDMKRLTQEIEKVLDC